MDLNIGDKVRPVKKHVEKIKKACSNCNHRLNGCPGWHNAVFGEVVKNDLIVWQGIPHHTWIRDGEGKMVVNINRE